MLSFSLLYVGVCPAATALVFCYFLIVNYLDKHEDLYCFLRPIAYHRPTTSVFTANLESIVVAIVILNTFTLYNLSPSFNIILQKTSGYEEGDSRGGANAFWILFGMEHLVIALILCAKTMIPDMPLRVQQKSEERAARTSITVKHMENEHEKALKTIKHY